VPGAAQGVPELQTAGNAPRQAETIDCATLCISGCIRPEACASAEARARVAALLEDRSLDDLVALASASLEARTRARAMGLGSDSL
jgi:diaminopimelate epimerase